jgi:hypothetical protein
MRKLLSFDAPANDDLNARVFPVESLHIFIGSFDRGQFSSTHRGVDQSSELDRVQQLNLSIFFSVLIFHPHQVVGREQFRQLRPFIADLFIYRQM